MRPTPYKGSPAWVAPAAAVSALLSGSAPRNGPPLLPVAAEGVFPPQHPPTQQPLRVIVRLDPLRHHKPPHRRQQRQHVAQKNAADFASAQPRPARAGDRTPGPRHPGARASPPGRPGAPPALGSPGGRGSETPANGPSPPARGSATGWPASSSSRYIKPALPGLAEALGVTTERFFHSMVRSPATVVLDEWRCCGFDSW